MESIEKAFYHDGYQLGLKAVETPDEKKYFEALSEMYAAIDKLNDSLFEFAASQGRNIACKKGCEWCCHQPVFALDYELDYLDTFIGKNFTSKQKQELKTRANEKNNKLSALNGDALLNAKHPCPLLKNGACAAYSARPMACRIYLSSDLGSCLNFYHAPDDKDVFPALLDFPMRAGRMMNEGFKAALKTKGILAKEFRIEEKLF